VAVEAAPAPGPAAEASPVNWPAVGGLAAALAVLVCAPFFAVTTFIGDDHLFLAFARYAPNPLIAFVRDQHGGEFYRPLPMLLWWVLGRLAPHTPAVFAAVALGLHVAAAALLGRLILLIRADRRVAVTAALLFFVAPLPREAAYWFAASTDLLAAVFMLGVLAAIVRGRTWQAVALGAGACWSKETAVVLPLLAAVVLAMRSRAAGPREVIRGALPLLGVVAAYAVARTVVLHGVGGLGDVPAAPAAKLVQVAAGLLHVMTGTQILGTVPALLIGLVVWALLLGATAREAWRSRPVLATGPVLILVLIAIAVAPLLGAAWVVGARYFYFPAALMAWLGAERLRRFRLPATVGVLGALAGLALGQDLARHTEVAAYEARLDAARRGVATGLGEGFQTFHVEAGIKDLDLAVKEDPRVRASEDQLLVLGDVPASFVVVPPGRPQAVDFLRARPPLPPAGAYRFGERRIVGLARQGDDPTLAEVTAHFPRIRFIRLRAAPGGRVIARDVTDTMNEEDEPDDQ
jgi:hypothetical protein